MKTKKEKVTKISKTKKVVESNVKSKPELSEFKLNIRLNDVNHSIDTNDLVSTFLSLKPSYIKTRTVIKVEKGGKSVEKILNVPKVRLLFLTESRARTFFRLFTRPLN